MNLTEHFTLAELTNSDTGTRAGIDNTPNVEQITNLQRLCRDTLEHVRTLSGNKTIRSSSGFRCPKLNKLIGGSPTSDHMNGNAVDFRIDGMSVTETVEMIMKSDIPFDQLIHEFDRWTHISNKGSDNRREVLRAIKQNGKTVYEKYVPKTS